MCSSDLAEGAWGTSVCSVGVRTCGGVRTSNLGVGLLVSMFNVLLLTVVDAVLLKESYKAVSLAHKLPLGILLLVSKLLRCLSCLMSRIRHKSADSTFSSSPPPSSFSLCLSGVKENRIP